MQCSRKRVQQVKKRKKKSCFLDFEKKYVCSFKNHLITPVVNTHYTIFAESH